MVKLSISVLLSLATISIRSNSVVAYRSHCNSIKLFSKSNCHYSSKDTLGNSYRHSYSSCYSNCYRHNQIYLSRFCLLQMTTQSTTTPTASSLLECQLDSYQRISHNKVLNCQQDTDSGNYILTLDNSVLYPEGGGQPWDLGTVNGIEVVKVLKTKNTANSNSDSTTVDVYVKDAVPIDTVVECKVDWERRYDHMQQHTAQVKS